MMRVVHLPAGQGRPSEGFGLLLVGVVVCALVLWVLVRSMKDAL
jgi:hypothetical protein